MKKFKFSGVRGKNIPYNERPPMKGIKMVTGQIEMQSTADVIQLVRDIETRQRKDDRAKKFAFWAGITIGAAAGVGALFAYTQYQDKDTK